ncbi:MAG: glycoside hydrolase family 2 protein [Dactylosporangium sp.]|nr:glycoside hydrolase family 2 protein [Dactylosporangium sp.]NNJ59763.1 glycoside hydrolase family 2 protein [Dactylosporangium sp.]
MTEFRQLHDGWTLIPVPGSLPAAVDAEAVPSGPVPATVPGCVHPDLLAAGLIDDLYLDDNEARLAWIGRTDWCYETTFAWVDAGHQRVDLVCAGLDTVATVTLNDVELGRTANMHRSYRFDVQPLLRTGSNRLSVRFDSAYRYAERQRDELGDRPHAYGEPFNFIRKMACNFGWDWGPTLVTAGIWRPIGLEAWSTARLAEVCPRVTVAGATGTVEVRVAVERATDQPLTVRAEIAGVTEEITIRAGERTATLALTVPSPSLWWPRGLGAQARYALAVTLCAGGTTLDRWRRDVGFRSVRLDTTPDDAGSAYTVVVNDTPVFVRGVNWIPDDCFPTRVDRARIAGRFAQAIDANVNYLRVWGGGCYESEDFYDLADEYGLMVGQDFLFACAAYPEEEPFASEIAAEAREQVARLAPHPSLLLWTGNNENFWGHVDWHWREPLAGRTWGEHYYRTLLPGIVAEVDPTRPYWPGSPYSGAADRHPNDPHHGTVHIWDVWNTHDYTHYRSYEPRFVSEFGFQGPPQYATLRRAISDDPLTPRSAGLATRQKQVDGNAKLLARLDGHLPAPETFDDWHHAGQLNQVRAIRFGIEHFRSLRGRCMGTILWQLNDCWPVTSWAVVDGDGRPKPAWYALRAAYADRLLTIQPRPAGLAVVAVNDGATPWSDRIEVVRRTIAGIPRAKALLTVEVPPGAARTVALPPDVAVTADPAAELIVAGRGAGRALWFFAEDPDLASGPPAYQAHAEPVDGGYRVSVTAVSLLRDVLIQPDRLDPAARVDEALVTLLPGETGTFQIRTGASLDPASLTTPPVLRCASHLLPGDGTPSA